MSSQTTIRAVDRAGRDRTAAVGEVLAAQRQLAAALAAARPTATGVELLKRSGIARRTLYRLLGEAAADSSEAVVSVERAAARRRRALARYNAAQRQLAAALVAARATAPLGELAQRAGISRQTAHKLVTGDFRDVDALNHAAVRAPHSSAPAAPPPPAMPEPTRSRARTDQAGG